MTGVSFLVTVYNKARYLPAVLAAIGRQQGDFDRETVIVDDGSTDGSLSVLQALARGRRDVTVIAQANAGASAALNRAAAAARLPLLKPVDADDLLLPEATALLVAALERTGAVLAAGRGID